MAVKKRKGRLEIWRSKKNRNYYWRFVQSNGRVTANSGDEGYTRRNVLLRTLKNMGGKLATGSFVVME